MQSKLFQRETQRKQKLMIEMERLEAESQKLFPRQSQTKKENSGIFNGLARVDAVRSNEVTLVRENGQSLGKLVINPQIANLIKPDDQLSMMAGRHMDRWHLLFLFGIISPLRPSARPKTHADSRGPVQRRLD